MLRCFDGSGIPLCMVSSDPYDLKFYSRHCHQKKIIADYRLEPEKALADLIDLGKSFSKKPVLFYDDDQFQLFISRNREKLYPYYHFPLPDHKMLEQIIEKTEFAALAERLSLPAPKTICSDGFETAEDALRLIALPCFFKPKNRVHWDASDLIKARGGKNYKGILAENVTAFNDAYHGIKKFTNDFIIQEYIPGGDNSIYSFHAYFNRDAQPLAYFAGRKIRDFPKECGQSTYLELVKDKEVVQLGIDILNKLDYVGLVKIDFKKDIRTNRLYILEINPRATLWNHLGAVSGVNLPLIAYRDILGQEVTIPKDYKTNIRWLSFLNDVKGFILDYHKDGDLSWKQWIFSYWSFKVYAVFSWKDPYPFIVDTCFYLKALFTRLTKRAPA